MGQIELSLYMLLEGLAQGHTGSSLQAIMVRVLNDISDILLALGNMLSDLSDGFLICYGVANTDTEAVME